MSREISGWAAYFEVEAEILKQEERERKADADVKQPYRRPVKLEPVE